MTLQADEEVFEVIHMLGDLAVKDDKHLAQKEKHVYADRIGDDFGQGLDLFLARIKFRKLSNF